MEFGIARGSRKILIVDDDLALRRTLRGVLEKNGFTVTEAANGKEAIKQVEAVGPDIVLTDIIMPEQDGMEIIPTLRKTFPGTKIIAMSGGGSLGMNDLLHIAEKLGADACIEKPFTNDTLLSEIQKVLASS